MFRESRSLIRVAVLALVLSACTSAHGFELSRVQRKDVRVLPGANGFVNPLTGVKTYSPQEWQNRRILAIKVGNSTPERPQAGLDSADVIYEELVEGGTTRFLALFSTNHAPRVGPVRSVRTVDHKIVQPLGALFAYSGGVPPVVAELRATPGVTDVGADRAGEAYRRDGNRNAPYNLYASTDALWSGQSGGPPKAQFDFLDSSQDASSGGEEAANDVKLSFAGNTSAVRFAYNTKTGVYERFTGDAPHTVEGVGGGQQLAVRNVLVQMVGISTGSTIDRAGERTNDISMIGDGAAVLFRGGRAIRGRWVRTAVGEPTRFVTTAGAPLRLAPGATMVELLPRGRDIFVT
jgi:hypothetical protein